MNATKIKKQGELFNALMYNNTDSSELQLGFLLGATWAYQNPDWTSTADAVPKQPKGDLSEITDTLLFCVKEKVYIGNYNYETEMFTSDQYIYDRCSVSHWMNLPKAPKKS